MAPRALRIAVEGCGHGTLHAIYASIAASCKQKRWSPSSIDLVIIGGDFQAVRNASDLHCVSMPAKYHSMCDFHEYYSGARVAPYLTIFVGGNHEASNYLQELYFGGWVAPRMYYMGAANVLRLTVPSTTATADGNDGEEGGMETVLRIAGMSGIWNGPHYRKAHVERLPYSYSDVRGAYHVRELDVRKLLQVRTQVDVGISHDWPQGVEWLGNWKQLFRWKKFFEEDARTGRLGSVAAKQVLEWLRPKYWFSAHLHVKYAAVVKHDGTEQDKNNRVVSQSAEVTPQVDEIPKNDDEIDLDMDDVDAAPPGQLQAAVSNTDEIDLDLDDDDVATDTKPSQSAEHQSDATATTPAAPDLTSARAALPAAFTRAVPPEAPKRPSAITNTATHFLSLDKCLANRDFLQLLTIEPNAGSSSKEVNVEEFNRNFTNKAEDESSRPPMTLSYDREWLAITRAFALSEPPTFGSSGVESGQAPPRAKSHTEYSALIDEQLAWVDTNISSWEVPENFTPVAPVYDGGDIRAPKYQPGGEGLILREYPNPQTAEFCRKLAIPNPLEMTDEEAIARMKSAPWIAEDGGDFGGGGRGRGGRGGGHHNNHRGHGRGGRGGRGRGRGRGH
jgi:lariat debranching enzyme